MPSYNVSIKDDKFDVPRSNYHRKPMIPKMKLAAAPFFLGLIMISMFIGPLNANKTNIRNINMNINKELLDKLANKQQIS